MWNAAYYGQATALGKDMWEKKGSGTVSTAGGTATVLRMDAVTGGKRGAAIRARREAIAWDKLALAERAGISRDTLANVEADGDGVRPQTYAKVERTLDELDEELGPGTDRGLEVTMRGVYGIDELIFRSPTQDPDVLADAVAKILDRLKNAE